MITLKDWMECVNFRITEGSEYGWSCYGSRAYSLDSWDGDHDGAGSSVLFDTETQTVYQVEVHDFSRNRSYRRINPDYAEAYNQECKRRGVNGKEAWDQVEHVDLDTDEDFLEKCRAIMNYEPYDGRVSVPLELPDDEIFRLMMLAHEQDITFNQLVEKIVNRAIEDFKRNPSVFKARN